MLFSGELTGPLTFTPTGSQLFRDPLCFKTPESRSRSRITNTAYESTDIDSDVGHVHETIPVQKYFLEPICDTCALKEHRQNMAGYADTQNGEGLIWGSTVEIEIDPQISKRSSTDSLDDRSPTSIDTASTSRFPIEPHKKKREPSGGPIPVSNSPGADADDEGSLKGRPFNASDCSQQLRDVHGRPRSNTKQMRRRGIDLSRDELRISSRWSSGEKRSMEDFRDAIRRKANGTTDEDPFLAWVTEMRRPIVEEAKAIKDKVVKSLQRSVSRGRSRRVQRGRGEDVLFRTDNARFEQENDDNRTSFSRHQGQEANAPRKVHNDFNSLISLPGCQPEPFSTIPKAIRSPREGHENDHKSWLQHLEHDLQPRSEDHRRLRHKKGHYILRQPMQTARVDTLHNRNQRKSLLPSNFFPDYHLRRSSSAGPLLHPSAELCHNIQEYHRLPSLALSTELDSTELSANWTLKEENLGDVICSSELGHIWHNDGNVTSISSSSPSSRQASSHLSTLDLIHAARRDLNRQFPEQKLDIYSPSSSAGRRDAERRIDSGHACGRSPHRGRLASSVSVPDSLNSRLSSFQQNDHEAMSSRKSKALALHPLAMQLPHENPVRPSIGAGFKRWE